MTTYYPIRISYVVLALFLVECKTPDTLKLAGTSVGIEEVDGSLERLSDAIRSIEEPNRSILVDALALHLAGLTSYLRKRRAAEEFRDETLDRGVDRAMKDMS